MNERNGQREERVEEKRKRAHKDDPTRKTVRQIDDNQDELGRDVNDPDRVANEINKTGH